MRPRPTPMTPADLELQLHRHGSALRSLAQDLARDAHAADDLVQATMQQALARRPAPGPLGGWLATVLRRLHLQRRRHEARRSQREQVAARPERLPSTIDQVERRDTLRAVTAAVFALDEPYQTAILLRYFEDLTPTEIAARTRSSIATVKSRLQRGLLQLRQRLDRSLGERRRWTQALCAATGLRLLAPTTILTTGALLMGPTTKLALGGAAALLLGALVWTLLSGEAAPTPMVTAATPPVAAAAAASSDTGPAPAAPDRVAVAEAAPIDNALLHPFAYELEVLVQDRLGLPVEGARVLLAPLGCTLDEVQDRTGADGIVRVQWRGRAASMPVLLAVAGDETPDALRQLTVASGSSTRVVLGGGSDGGRHTYVRGKINGDLALSFGASRTAERLAVKLDQLVIEADTFRGNPAMRAGLHPFARFADAQLHLPQPAEVKNVEIAIGQLVLDNARFEVHHVALAREAGTPPAVARLEGHVYGEDGKPCAKCPVAWSRSADRASERTETDDQGAFRFDNVPEGALELRAGGSDAGLQHQTVSTMRGQTASAELQLRRDASVRGHAVDAAGKPLAGWRVEWVGTQTPWFDACKVADDGSFVLPNLPGGAGQLLLWNSKNNLRMPVLQLGNVLPDNGDTVLHFDAAVASGRLQLEPLLPDGVDKGAVEVRIVQEETLRGTTMRKAKDRNSFFMSGLAAGWYRLEVGGPGLAWLDAGRHYVDGKGLVDLGRVALTGASHVQLQFAEGAKPTADANGGSALEIYRRRADSDVRIEDTAAGLGDPLPLPPGDYFVLWRLPTGAKGFTPFTVQAGRDTAVQCMDRDVQAWHAETAGPARERR